MNKYYIDNILDRSFRGWLPVLDSDNNQLELSAYTRISTTKSKKLLKVLGGIHKGKVVTIDESRLPHRVYSEYLSIEKDDNVKTLELHLNLSESSISFLMDNKPVTTSVSATHFEVGEYRILTPSKRFSMSNVYLREGMGGSRFAETWFPIDDTSVTERYIHYGTYSLGCVTILDSEAWNRIYLCLLRSQQQRRVCGVLKITE